MSVFDSFLRWLLPTPIIPEYISEDVLSELIGASEEQLPNEFLALLVAKHSSEVEFTHEALSDTYVIDSYYVIPGTTSSPKQASLKSHNVPVSGNVVGSFHSHPSGVLQPSTEDLNMFQKYPVNIITGHPFNIETWKSFSSTGENVTLTVIQTEDSSIEDFDF